MKQALPRLLLALAMQLLGSRRRNWALAMAYEFEIAARDGQAFRFAFGCLLGACRSLPHHAEGRFMLASYALVFGLFLPMATALSMAATAGFPFVEASDGIHGLMSGSGSYRLMLDAGTLALGPALTLVMLLLAACHLPAAWWVLDRDWHRVGTALHLAAAIMATLAIVTACAALDFAVLLVPFAALVAEAVAIAGLARFKDAGCAEEPAAIF
ncbi:MAG: hypothetical protein PGN16_19570 [Sphingomonas phyllosphaerae]|uniref:hypothetical protein n=1 Tax=Sphingomonas phyllosphaerae TaxID=257003 RepID=UPI002FF86E12